MDGQRPDGRLRLNPEGLRIHGMQVFISDEYGKRYGRHTCQLEIDLQTDDFEPSVPSRILAVAVDAGDVPVFAWKR